jgi:hypothetical protein
VSGRDWLEMVESGWNCVLVSENRRNELEVDGNGVRLVKVFEVRGK